MRMTSPCGPRPCGNMSGRRPWDRCAARRRRGHQQSGNRLKLFPADRPREAGHRRVADQNHRAVRRPAGHRARRHPTRRAAECDIHCRTAAPQAGVRRRRPVKRIVGLMRFVGERGAIEKRINRRRMARVGRARIIHEALQFLHARQPPVVVAEKFLRVFFAPKPARPASSCLCRCRPWTTSGRSRDRKSFRRCCHENHFCRRRDCRARTRQKSFLHAPPGMNRS